jgi:multidrug resistance protein, MATE family
MSQATPFETSLTTTPHWRRWPIVELLVLAAPTVAQMASYTLMQFTDRYMLARVGDLQAAAAGTAGITYFAVVGFGFGVLLVVNTMVSQSFGRNDLTATGRYLWQGIWFALVFGMVTLLMRSHAEQIFLAMGHERRMADIEATFMRVIALSGAAKLMTTAMSQFLLGLQRPVIVLVATVLGIVANLFFNWLLIYGNWGFRALGVAGSAWGTNAAIMVELLVMAAFIFRPAFARIYATFDWRIRLDMLGRLLRVGLPAGFQLICDICAWTIFMNVIVARFGTAALSANSFAFSYMHVCFMPAIGVGQAVTALVGKYIGMGRPDLAARRAHLGFGVCAIYMVLAGLALFMWRYPLIGIFSSDPAIQRIGAQLMMFVALYQLCDAMFVIYVGALRGAGDTLVPAVVQATLVWTIVVGGGLLTSRYAPQYGVTGPWTLATIFGGILGIFLLTRFLRGGWKNIRLHGDGDDDAVARSQQETDSDRVSNLQLTAES